MRIVSLSSDKFQADVTREELRILKDCLNNVLEIEDWEFPILIGATKDEVSDFLETMQTALTGQ